MANFERMLRNAGQGMYQALRKAPQDCMNSAHEMHSGRAKGPKSARNSRFFCFFSLPLELKNPQYLSHFRVKSLEKNEKKLAAPGAA